MRALYWANAVALTLNRGYLLGRSMNNMLEVERAPFKLTRDHVAVMGGEFSANFISYISLCVQGLQVREVAR